MSERHSPPPAYDLPPIEKNPFTMDYFLYGKQKGVSNYENYHYMEPETVQYAQNLLMHLGVTSGDTLHDIGCSRGYVVKVLRMLGYEATGHDISDWAISNCHPDVKDFVSTKCDYPENFVDWITSKDCLEHWDDDGLRTALPKMFAMARKGCFFIVPLTAYWGGKYIYPADNEDKTHRIRMTLEAWMKMLVDATNGVSGNFSINGSFHMHGLKKASVDYPYSTGFFTVRRYSA